MRIKVTSVTKKSNMKKYMDKANDLSSIEGTLRTAGGDGLSKLISATPKKTGTTAASWNMDVEKNQNGLSLYYSNSKKISDGTPLVVLIVNGHGTGTGGYVPANDFVSPIVDKIADQVAKEVKHLIE